MRCAPGNTHAIVRPDGLLVFQFADREWRVSKPGEVVDLPRGMPIDRARWCYLEAATFVGGGPSQDRPTNVPGSGYDGGVIAFFDGDIGELIFKPIAGQAARQHVRPCPWVNWTGGPV
jgi:hypothetical protein